jgi:hypothetical protein
MRFSTLVLTVTVLVSSAAHAGVQQPRGSEEMGRFTAGFDPIGVQSGFNGSSPSGYKIMGDFAGRLARPGFGGVYLGGGLNFAEGVYGCGVYVVNGFAYANDCGTDVQLWMFVMLTFERLIPIKLVPFFRAGAGGEILGYNQYGNGGAFILRFGGGVHYYLLRWLGLGVQTNFTFGPGFYPQPYGSVFYGSWDFGIGARFTF